MGFTQRRAGRAGRKKKEPAQSKEEENGLNQVRGKTFRRSQPIIWLMMMMFNFVWAEALINRKNSKQKIHSKGLTGGVTSFSGVSTLELCDRVTKSFRYTSPRSRSDVICDLPPVPENVKRKHENINIEKHHASFPSELCYMRTQECEVCGGRPESASCKFFDRRCYHVMAIKSFQG